MRVISLALFALAARAGEAPSIPPEVQTALENARVTTGLRVEAISWRPNAHAGCSLERAESGAVRGSGRIALRTQGRDLDGRLCVGSGWAEVRVSAGVLVVARHVAHGESLEGAVRTEQREVRAGHTPVTALPPGATAARSLEVGRPLEPEHVDVGPPPGSEVLVRISQGPLRVEKLARRVPCGSGRFCAAFGNGKRTEGRWDGKALWVEAR